MDMAAEILRNEGGFVDNPDDKGGPTNYGISLRFAVQHPKLFDLNKDGVVDKVDIISLTPEIAKRAYVLFFYRFENVQDVLDDIGAPEFAGNIVMQMFDFAVTSGPSQAIKCLQRSVNTPDDGELGPNTLNSLKIACEMFSIPLVNNNLTDERIKFYEALGQPQFLDGWKKRANKYRMEVP
jgi:lysozyme family protein